MQPFPHPKDDTDKILLKLANWSWSIIVRKCGQRRTTTTDDGSLLYYKLTFGSGELKRRVSAIFPWGIHIWNFKTIWHASWTHGRGDNPKPICPFNFFDVGGIINLAYQSMFSFLDISVLYEGCKMISCMASRRRFWRHFTPNVLTSTT